MPPPQQPAIDFAEMLARLAAVYPEVHRLLGARDFDACGSALIETHAAISHDLNELTRAFPEFIAASSSSCRARNFIADLARLERAHLEVLHAAAAPRLTTAELAELTGEEWERTHLVTVPALRLLALRHPIHRYLALAGDRNDAPLPGARPSWIAVWRDGATTMRSELTRSQYTILNCLAEGHSLGAAVARAADNDDDPRSLATSLGGWFRAWTSAGWFTTLVTDPPSIAEPSIRTD